MRTRILVYGVLALGLLASLLLAMYAQAGPQEATDLQISDASFGDASVLDAPWSSNVRVTDGPIPSAAMPAVAVGTEGHVYAVWNDSRTMVQHIYFARSSDQGASWSTNAQIDELQSGQTLADIAVDDAGIIHVTWADQREGPTPNHRDIYYARSIDGGASWTDHHRINDDAGIALQNAPAIAVDSSSNVYLVWSDRRNGNDDIYCARSIDSGLSWGSNRRVDNDTGTAAQTNPAIAIDLSDRVYVVWRDERNADGDIYAAWSADGTSWSTGFRVNDDTGAFYQDHPAITAWGSGLVYAVWADGRNEGSAFSDIYFARSVDGGVSWGTNHLVDDSGGGTFQDYPSIGVDAEGRLYAVWEDGRHDPRRDIYSSESVDGGVTWNVNSKVNDDAFDVYHLYADCAVDSQGNVYAVWEDRRPTGRGIYAARQPSQAAFPRAQIDDIWYASYPDPALQGRDTIYFRGSGQDFDEGGDYIAAYTWVSSLDGPLEAKEDFTVPANELSVGTHAIVLQVQDDEGLWSPAVTATLKVQAVEPDVRTLILVNQRKLAEIHSSAQASLLITKVNTLREHPDVKGIVREVESDADVSTSYAAWDSDPTSMDKANAVSAAIKDVVLADWAAHPGLEYLVIVGDDRVIPFRRVDIRGYGEGEYAFKWGPFLSCNGVTGAAVCISMTLTDDYYGDKVPTVPSSGLWHGTELYIPDLGTGRLIETPEEIIGQIDAFMNSGSVTVTDAIVIGYDFLKDSAGAMCKALRLDGIATDCNLIGENWRLSDFMTRMLNTRHEFVSVNVHAFHFLMRGPGMSDLFASHVVTATADHTGALFYSIGCTAGLNVPPDNPSWPLDLAQALMQRHANYAGNTGYGRGSSVIAHSELLMLNLTKRLVYGRSATIGQALVAAKQEFYLNLHRFADVSEKSMIEFVFYGLPMFRYWTPAVTGIAVSAQSQSSGTEPRKEERTATLSNGLTVNHISYRFPPFTEESTPDGVYHSLGGEVHGGDGEPVQPKYVADLSLPRTKAHGVVFAAGVYSDLTPVDPLVDHPLTESGPRDEPPFDAPGWHPIVLQFNHLERGDRLVAVLGQFRASSQTERLYDRLSLDVYYHPDSEDWVPPRILSMSSELLEATATVNVRAEDISGIHTAIVAYTHGDGEWNSAALNHSESSWTGDFSADAGTEFFVQVVDGAGNVAVLDRGGLYYRPGESVSLVPQIFLPLIMKPM